VQKVEQVVRLVRSKGVGVFFITQVPSDIPDSVLSQLGNRVQHALRAYTPSDQKAVRAAADSFRANPSFDTATAIGELATGEALVSLLDADGKPGVVERAKVIAPCCSMGTCPDDVREKVRSADALAPKYLAPIDRPSAFESLSGQPQPAQSAPVTDGTNPQGGTTMDDQTQPTAVPTSSAATPVAATAPAPVAAPAATVPGAAAPVVATAPAPVAAAPVAAPSAAETAKEQAEAAKAQAEAAKAQAEAEIAQAKAQKAKADAEAAEARADKAKQSASAHQKSDAEKLAGSVATSMSRSIGTSVARGLMDALKKNL
jgi:chemotaxis protein histidine kinase CheA